MPFGNTCPRRCDDSLSPVMRRLGEGLPRFMLKAWMPQGEPPHTLVALNAGQIERPVHNDPGCDPDGAASVILSLMAGAPAAEETVHGEHRWDSVFAAIYDRMMRRGEERTMVRRRSELIASARGRTLEIGAGTGANIPYYPDDVEELILAEPFEPMRRRLERKLSESGRAARTIDASAEAIPLDDDSVDTVVSTLVLCTVDFQNKALAEVGRILRPGGQLLFIEHVRSQSPRVARWQDRLKTPWRRFAAGCRCNRDTISSIEAAGFSTQHEDAHWEGVPPIVAPLVIGRAVKE
jgi:ubiquinone/menaquinone biosynthesis C-methylase UbiE